MHDCVLQNASHWSPRLKSGPISLSAVAIVLAPALAPASGPLCFLEHACKSYTAGKERLKS
jgi:hypothetical protein